MEELEQEEGWDEMENGKIARWISICSTIALLAMFASFSYGCHEYTEGYSIRYKACVENGGTFIASNENCVPKH